ncbi:uncharacterized protein ARMOST_01354 [Armillaria ostoyae]|uniref:Uncharacterized protein n=1 Tax=Armillaria ostoyae TaxID=47428 RepID=A0A284QNR7_ARMOS|nr:uncharacterized protein ARMOST_01354 [Armillaria ostoyae]
MQASSSYLKFIQSSSSSSSSSSSKSDRPAYSTADSKWIKVNQWDDDLVATAASSSLAVAWIKYKKLATGVNHEYLLFDVSDNTLFVTERYNEDPPDYTVTKAQEANTLLATLTPSSEHTLPERTFARILTLVSKAPNYHWYTGSVYETVRVGLKGVKEEKTDEYKHRGEVELGWWWWAAGSDPETVPIPSLVPPPGVERELPYERIIKDFGQPENLTVYQKVHEKNIGPLQVVFDDPLEKQLTKALRGLVGFILRDLAGPLRRGEKLEGDLPVLRDWLRQASLSVIR